MILKRDIVEVINLTEGQKLYGKIQLGMRYEVKRVVKGDYIDLEILVPEKGSNDFTNGEYLRKGQYFIYHSPFKNQLKKIGLSICSWFRPKLRQIK